jgi:hypothetical protein
MLIDLSANPSLQDGFIVAQDRSFLKPCPESLEHPDCCFEHAKASAAKRLRANGPYGDCDSVPDKFRLDNTPRTVASGIRCNLTRIRDGGENGHRSRAQEIPIKTPAPIHQ